MRPVARATQGPLCQAGRPVAAAARLRFPATGPPRSVRVEMAAAELLAEPVEQAALAPVQPRTVRRPSGVAEPRGQVLRVARAGQGEAAPRPRPSAPLPSALAPPALTAAAASA